MVLNRRQPERRGVIGNSSIPHVETSQRDSVRGGAGTLRTRAPGPGHQRGQRVHVLDVVDMGVHLPAASVFACETASEASDRLAGIAAAMRQADKVIRR